MEQFLAVEQLHDQMHRPCGGVNNEFMHLDDVWVAQLHDVLELRADAAEQLCVPRDHPFYSEFPARVALDAALDEAEGAFPDDIGLLKAVREGLVSVATAVDGVDLHVLGVREEQEDVVLRLGPSQREVC